ncbi:MAG: hypothetical protein IJY65_04705 [Clostridia bacterium]|nr:hypothetical protein [Clostridia bacterium]
MIKIGVAGLVIGIENRYEHIERLTRGYTVDGAVDFSVSASDAEIEEEMTSSNLGNPISYYESIVVYRKIAERLPEYDAFVFHGAVLSDGNGAYAFTARSGVGKTTHIRLWLSEFDDVRILNGDKPIVRIMNGTVYACGTPWRGKENYGECEIAPLRAITFLERGSENATAELSEKDATLRFLSQIYMPKSPVSVSKTLALAGRVLSTVGRVRLWCNMEPEAAHVCRSAIEKFSANN